MLRGSLSTFVVQTKNTNCMKIFQRQSRLGTVKPATVEKYRSQVGLRTQTVTFLKFSCVKFKKLKTIFVCRHSIYFFLFKKRLRRKILLRLLTLAVNENEGTGAIYLNVQFEFYKHRSRSEGKKRVE